MTSLMEYLRAAGAGAHVAGVRARLSAHSPALHESHARCQQRARHNAGGLLPQPPAEQLLQACQLLLRPLRATSCC
jgi:hypothetical protein